MPKNAFFEGTKKIFCAKFFWHFLYMYKGGLCKKKTLPMRDSNPDDLSSAAQSRVGRTIHSATGRLS